MALLRNQYLHRSRDIVEMNLIECHHHFRMEEPNEMIVPYLEEVGFLTVVKLGSCNVDPSLVIAMVEHWRTETHTFHLPIGECTITLEDVALQLGLPINGRPVTGGGALDWDEECQQLLGVIPPKNQMVGQFVKLKWLKDTFAHVPNNAAAEQLCTYYGTHDVVLQKSQLNHHTDKDEPYAPVDEENSPPRRPRCIRRPPRCGTEHHIGD
uniref:Protein MAINTENANCE OF MERISTEMS-like n=1 Tax=Cicer arietinum TaxID=3827 RepID=A0A1S2YJ10_CICAR|nr:protein MAINTENANCE OF MERISTEMS-like [Cicer arietinum]